MNVLLTGKNGHNNTVVIDQERNLQIKKALPEITELFQQQALEQHLPGYIFGIIADGECIYSQAEGFLDLKQKRPVRNKSMFRIASMTKSFTALAIIKLRDEGKLCLEDPIEKYIPEIAHQDLPLDAPQITIRHLLTQQAGFPEDNPWGDRQLDLSDTDFLKFIKNGISFSNIPGYCFEYSNLGFALLGVIITKVSGICYQDYIIHEICNPIGMEQVEWEYSNIDPSDLAYGYRWEKNQWLEEPLLHDGSFGAMGGLITSLDSFISYVAFHLSAWPVGDHSDPKNNANPRIISRSSIREMHHLWNVNEVNSSHTYLDGSKASITNGYGYGLRWQAENKNQVVTGHTGGLPGFGSNWYMMPEYGIGIVSFANRTYARMLDINILALKLMVEKAQLKPYSTALSNILKTRKAELLAILPDWKITQSDATNLFAKNFFLDTPVEILKEKTTACFEAIGSSIRVEEIVPLNQLRGSFKIIGTDGTLKVRFTLSPEKNPLIQQFEISLVLGSDD